MSRSFARSAAAVILFLACLFGGCSKKPDPTGATRIFFDQIVSGKFGEAYQSAAFAFQSQQTEKAFGGVVRELGLQGATELRFGNPEITGRTAKVSVSAKTSLGEQRPFVVTLQQESGAWRVFALKSPRSTETGLVENRFSLVGKSTAFAEPQSQPTPSDKETRAMVEETLLKFNEAIQQNSFADFYSYVSQAWQVQLTEKQLARAFQNFIDEKIDISTIKGREAKFTGAPFITSEGFLLAEGEIEGQPKVFFSLKYVYEFPEWKLFGIEVATQEKPVGE